MAEGKGPRIVWTLNALGRVGLGFIYSDGTSQGPELVKVERDAQSNKIGFVEAPGVYGKNFVEVGEDTAHLGDDEREAFTHKTEEVFVGVTDEPESNAVTPAPAPAPIKKHRK